MPYGLCECGCGRPTTIADRTSKRDGMVKGQPRRFITGHNARNPSYGEILPGDRFGRWTVQSVLGSKSVCCICACGCSGTVYRANLFNGSSQSCGCARVEQAATRVKHGHARDRRTTKLYRTWAGMLSRCQNPANAKYARYGGRGIAVCQRWRASFQAFADDMGEPPSPKHSIDRINNDGNYEPGNCRWALPQVQRLNRSDLKLSAESAREIVEQRRAGMTHAEIAKHHGVSLAAAKAVAAGRNWAWATGLPNRREQHA